MRRGSVFVLLALLACISWSRATELPAGTRIKLTLQRTLSTQPKGGVLGLIGVKPISREQTAVVYEVAEDVYDDTGRKIIEAGTPAVGRVIDSQVAGGMRMQPRLATTIEKVWTVDGKEVALRFETKHEGQWAHRFTRGETGAYVKSLREDENGVRFAPPVNQEAVEDVFRLLVNGEGDDLIRDPKRIMRLGTFAKQSGLEDFVRFLQAGGPAQLIRLMAELQSGSFAITRLSDVLKFVQVFKLTNDAWRAGSQVSRWMNGRVCAPQILAPAGFPMEAIVAE